MDDIRVSTVFEEEYMYRYKISLWKDDATRVSSGMFSFLYTRYGEGFIKTMITGAVATPPEYRRNGYVRKIFDHAYEIAAQEGALVALMHPFSFSYYHKFGYGKVADHLIVRCPIRLIDFVPRYNDLVPFTGTEEQLQDLITVYNKFSEGRLLMMRRFNDRYFKNKKMYIYYEEGKPLGYIAYKEEKVLRTNHYEDGLLTVHELAYTTPGALRALLGFIRMYEGELDDVEFENISMCPEVERCLTHYTHTRYRVLPDISARILDTEGILRAHKYPKEKGMFRIRVLDTLPKVAGSFQVEYGNGKCEVKRLNDNEEVQMTIEAAELVRLLYGYDLITPAQAAYTEGITIHGNIDDFFRAFPKMTGGMYEHF